MEARAIKTVFSDHATSGTLAFSSTKVEKKMPDDDVIVLSSNCVNN